MIIQLKGKEKVFRIIREPNLVKKALAFLERLEEGFENKRAGQSESYQPFS